MSTAVAAVGLAGGVCQAKLPSTPSAVFVTNNYGLTFASPNGASYCPLPTGWTGSDHGTIVFLVPPSECGGVGYPSNSLDYRPSDVSRIEIYYGYALEDIELKLAPCNRVGITRLFGSHHAICEIRNGLAVRQTIHASYMLDERSEVSITLVTAVERLEQDRATFRKLVASVRSCSSVFRVSGHKQANFGSGPACPKGTFH